MGMEPIWRARVESRPALSAAAPDVLVLEGVSRTYGATRGLASTSLRLGPGSVCTVSGANGSGKTTLLRLAAGLVAPTTGRRRVVGTAVYLAPGDGARDGQTVLQAVAFAAAVSGRPAEVDRCLEVAGLTAVADRRARTLSSGLRARLTLAVCLACAPGLACLDEPTAHLDADGVGQVDEIVALLAEGGAAVLVATHDPALLAARADARLHVEAGRLTTAEWPSPAVGRGTGRHIRR